MFYERVENGTFWKGQTGLYLLTFMNLGVLEIATDISDSNVTHPFVQTVGDGKVDISPFYYYVIHEYYQFIDYIEYKLCCI